MASYLTPSPLSCCCSCSCSPTHRHHHQMTTTSMLDGYSRSNSILTLSVTNRRLCLYVRLAPCNLPVAPDYAHKNSWCTRSNHALCDDNPNSRGDISLLRARRRIARRRVARGERAPPRVVRLRHGHLPPHVETRACASAQSELVGAPVTFAWSILRRAGAGTGTAPERL